MFVSPSTVVLLALLSGCRQRQRERWCSENRDVLYVCVSGEEVDFLVLLRFQSTTHHPYIPLNLAFYCCIYNPFPSSCIFTSVCSSALPMVSRDMLFYLFWTYTFFNSVILRLSPPPLFLELIVCIKSPCRLVVYISLMHTNTTRTTCCQHHTSVHYSIIISAISFYLHSKLFKAKQKYKS